MSTHRYDQSPLLYLKVAPTDTKVVARRPAQLLEPKHPNLGVQHGNSNDNGHLVVLLLSSLLSSGQVKKKSTRVSACFSSAASPSVDPLPAFNGAHFAYTRNVISTFLRRSLWASTCGPILDRTPRRWGRTFLAAPPPLLRLSARTAAETWRGRVTSHIPAPLVPSFSPIPTLLLPAARLYGVSSK